MNILDAIGAEIRRVKRLSAEYKAKPDINSRHIGAIMQWMVEEAIEALNSGETIEIVNQYNDLKAVK